MVSQPEPYQVLVFQGVALSFRHAFAGAQIYPAMACAISSRKSAASSGR